MPSATRSTAAGNGTDLERALQEHRRILVLERARLYAHESDDDKKWDDYLRESILQPEVKIVKGINANGNPFGKEMPSQASSFSGTPYKEKELQAIIEYIKSVGDPSVLQADADTGSRTGEFAGSGREIIRGGRRETASGSTPEETGKPTAGDRFADRPSDRPVDKSPAARHGVKKEEEK